MQVEISKMETREARITVRGIHPYHLNTLRKYMVSRVPKMAIERVEFHLGPIMDEHGNEFESKTPLFDEVVAHRLSLVPIPTDLKKHMFRKDCTCEGVGCGNCEVGFTLNKRGPCVVYSGDLEPITDMDMKIPGDDALIPVVKLDEDQAVLIYAFAQLGTGKEHAKYQAAIATGYKNFPIVTIKKDRCTKCKKCYEGIISACPSGVLEASPSGVPRVIKGKEAECTLCMVCQETCQDEVGDEPAIMVTWEPQDFIFRFETDGAYIAKDLLFNGLEGVRKGLEDFKDQVNALPSEPTVRPERWPLPEYVPSPPEEEEDSFGGLEGPELPAAGTAPSILDDDSEGFGG